MKENTLTLAVDFSQGSIVQMGLREIDKTKCRFNYFVTIHI